MLFGACHATQASGVITITGSLTDTTCRINNQDPPFNLLVRLPRIGINAIPEVNNVAGTTRFTIRLTDCPVALNSRNVRMFFEHGSTTDFGTNNLLAYGVINAVDAAAGDIPAAPGTANTRVQIQILNMNGTPILLGQESADQNSANFEVIPVGAIDTSAPTTHGVDMHYLARYIRTATGTITAGHLVSYVRYSIVYP